MGIVILNMIWIHFTGKYTGTNISILDNPIPYFTFQANEWLKKYLKKDMLVFEWGSGGSTIYIAKRVRQITSIEYSDEWYSKMKWYLRLKSISNCELKFIPPEYNQDIGNISDLSQCRSNNPAYQNATFKKYCEYIKQFPKNYFDLIIVDGRARPSCLAIAKDYVKIGGYILLDDAERETYNDGCELLKGFERTDFPGPGPYAEYEWKTSLFKRIK